MPNTNIDNSMETHRQTEPRLRRSGLFLPLLHASPPVWTPLLRSIWNNDFQRPLVAPNPQPDRRFAGLAGFQLHRGSGFRDAFESRPIERRRYENLASIRETEWPRHGMARWAENCRLGECDSMREVVDRDDGPT
jgi:hypothetical protein